MAISNAESNICLKTLYPHGLALPTQPASRHPRAASPHAA